MATKPRRAKSRARIGTIVTGPNENRALLDRSNVRWISFKGDMQAETARLGDDVTDTWRRFADEFRQQWEGWQRFYEARHDDWIGDVWPLSDLGEEIERWDATLEAYRARYREITDRAPTSVTDSSTAPRGPLSGPALPNLNPIGDSIFWIAIAALAVAVAYTLGSGALAAPIAALSRGRA